MASFQYHRVLNLLDQVGAANSAPTGDDGLDMNGLRDPASKQMPEFASVAIRGTRASGTASAIFRLWFKFPGVTQGWMPAGVGADDDKGKLNDDTLVGEVTGNEMRHAQAIRLPSHAVRMYLEVLSPTGTGLAINAVLVVDKTYKA